MPKWTTVVRRSPKQKPSVQPVAVQTTTRNGSTKGVTGSGQGRVNAAAVAAFVAAAVKHRSELEALEIERSGYPTEEWSALEIEELAIQQRKRALELDIQLAKAMAERYVYDQMEATRAASLAASRKSSVVMAIDRLTTADMTEPAGMLEENAPDVNYTSTSGGATSPEPSELQAVGAAG